jgi:hypothetical protein
MGGAAFSALPWQREQPSRVEVGSSSRALPQAFVRSAAVTRRIEDPAWRSGMADLQGLAGQRYGALACS